MDDAAAASSQFAPWPAEQSPGAAAAENMSGDGAEAGGAPGAAQPPAVSNTLPTILCCLCGTPITANPSNMCVNCIRSQVDLSEGIPKQTSIFFCRVCERYLSPPKSWVVASLESKELLALCLRRLRGLSRVKVVDAAFVWTEPHSRRIRVKLTVQKDVFNNTILQQTFVVAYIVELQQCPDCRCEAANIDAWQAVAQVRQKVSHKRTFLYLEQLILKHNAHEDALGIKQHPDGIDFYFLHRSHALKFISFLNSVVSVRHKQSDHLVTHDPRSNVYKYKYTFSVEIAPVCRDDLVCLPRAVSAHLGGVGPLVLVHRVSNWLSVVAPDTCQAQSTDSNFYWRHAFSAVLSSRQLKQFVVLDIEPSDMPPQQQQLQSSGNSNAAGSHRFLPAEAVVARASDFGANDQQFVVRTHLGHVLRPGDMALGYDLATANLNNEEMDRLAETYQLPDVVLVRKAYPSKNRARRRKWMLRELVMQDDGHDGGPTAADAAAVGGGARGRRGKERDSTKGRDMAEREAFMQEIEEDPELRQSINLYRDPSKALDDAMSGMSLARRPDRKWTAAEKASGQARRNAAAAAAAGQAADGGNAFAALGSHHCEDDGDRDKNDAVGSGANRDGDDGGDGGDDDSGDDDDYPEVPVDELLDALAIGGGADDDEEEEQGQEQEQEQEQEAHREPELDKSSGANAPQ